MTKKENYKQSFDSNFENDGKDYLNKMFESAKKQLAIASKKRDAEQCLLYLRVLDEIAGADVVVKDNVATMSFPTMPTKVFALNKDSITLNGKEFENPNKQKLIKGEAV